MAKTIDLSTTVQHGNRTLTIRISEQTEAGNEFAVRELQSELDNVVSAFQKTATQNGNQQNRGNWNMRQPYAPASKPQQNSKPRVLADAITIRQLDTLKKILNGNPAREREICAKNGVRCLEDLSKSAAWHIINEFGND